MAISTSITWEITNVDRDLLDNFITAADYKVSGICTVTTGAASTTYGPVSEYGHAIFNTSRTGEEVEYGNVTQDNVLIWVKNSMAGITTIGPPDDCVIGVESELKEKDVTDHLWVLYTKDSQKSTGNGTPWGT